MDIACLGLMVCDILVKPITREVLERDSSSVDFVKMSSGGDAFNVAVNLAKIGMHPGIIGKVGDDQFGRFLIETAIENKVDASGVKVTRDCGTSTSVVLIRPDGERSFAFYSGATGKLIEADIDYDIIKKAGMLSVGSAFALPGLDGTGLADVLKKARNLGVKTSVDVTELPPDNPMALIRPVLEHTDIFIPSYGEAKGISGREKPEDIAGVFHDCGVGLVVIKLGSDGCYISSGGETFSVPAYKVNVVDTTGAGDAFVSGFLTAYSKGWPLFECGSFANAVGAMSVQEVGATTGVKSFEQIMEFMKANS